MHPSFPRRTRRPPPCKSGSTIRARAASRSRARRTPAARVTVSILHWGTRRESARADTLACLASVAASRHRPARIVVVDNGTATLDAATVAAAAPGGELIAAPHNLGFAGGHNLVIREALAGGATHVFLLNNDARLDPGCLDALLDAAGPQVAAVGAKVLDAADPGRLWLAWGRITWRAALVERVGRGAPDGPPFDVVRAVDWVPGCAMLLARDALAAVGGFDETFFAYHEDVDWCATARERGFRIVFAPGARVLHRGEGSLGARGPANPARYLSARNTVLFARKHGSAAQRVRLAATIAASLALETVRPDADPAVTRLLWRGYRDGLLQRPLPLEALGLR